ncbi:glycine-rich domain-containing protein [Klebsiella michiganensis]|uniref:glycine-rich domain-containing protein n=1 Tax=Klebsiella michiganensis TaxID=1134687 RepID=UPI002FE6244E
MKNIMPPIDTPDNKFKDGNPTTGELGTLINALFMNNLQSSVRDVQSELMSVLSAAGINPDGDSVIQLLSSIRILTPGRLLNTQIFTETGTITKTPGATKWRIRIIGGGGSSSSPSPTSINEVSVCCGGGAGAYAEGIYDVSGINSALVTIGAGGTAGTPSSQNGTDGGTTSVGTLISAPGGKAGLPAGPAVPPFQPVANTNTNNPVGWNIAGTPGAGAEPAVAVDAQYAIGSRGADSQLGAGGHVPAINNPANTGAGYGSGASGCSIGPSHASVSGADGNPGIAIIEEYA